MPFWLSKQDYLVTEVTICRASTRLLGVKRALNLCKSIGGLLALNRQTVVLLFSFEDIKPYSVGLKPIFSSGMGYSIQYSSETDLHKDSELSYY